MYDRKFMRICRKDFLARCRKDFLARCRKDFLGASAKVSSPRQFQILDKLISVFFGGEMVFFGEFSVKVCLVVEPGLIHDFLDCFR